MSSLAVFLVLGGATAFAASHLHKNSVGPRQLKAKAVITAKIADGSVTSAKLGDGSVIGAKLGDGTVLGGKLADGATTTAKLADGAVSAGKLAADSVVGSKVSPGSIDLSDLAGADTRGNVSFSLASNTCSTLNLTTPGAVPGQVPILAFTSAAPSTLVVGPLRVSGADVVSGAFCNVGAGTLTVTDLGVRIVTFG